MKNPVIVVALIQGGMTLIGIFLTWYVNNKLSKVHSQINGRMDQMLEMKKEEGKEEGKKEEAAEVKK